MQGLFRGKPRIITAILTITALGALVLPAASAAPAPRTSAPSAPTSVSMGVIKTSKAGTMTSVVRGTFGTAGVVRGTFKPIRSMVSGPTPYVWGVLHATLVRGNGTVVGHVTRRLALPISGANNGARTAAATAAATCQILNLVLGPLDLNLLGLHVHLNRVVLHITAIPGPGNLLGNLLCAVAGLLDTNSILSRLQLANVLNRILNILSIV
jgi:hypothetical protein